MSEFRVEVVRIGEVTKHPNADSLSITQVYGFPVILKTGDFVEGDLAAYVPVDSVVPEGERFAFLGEHRRIRAKRLRGVFSMGLLTKTEPSWTLGQDVVAELGITKYDESSEPVGLGDEPGPGSLLPTYKVEQFRRWPQALIVGEEVVIAEKLDGACARFTHDGTRLWVGSHTVFKLDAPESAYWQVARRYDLARKLEGLGVAVYGEVHAYGEGGMHFFDALDTKTRTWLDEDDLRALCARLGLPMVPVLYRGSWSPELVRHAEGKSTVDPRRVREGFVVRPVKERYDMLGCGRVILKLHGEGFLTRGQK
jgi:RNA ligase (TIGR02306 family)